MSARPRQRIHFSGNATGLAARVVVALFALAVLVYAIALALLALKVSGDTVNTFTGYRDAYVFLRDLDPGDATSGTRLIAGLTGLAAFLVFGWLTWRELPRPRLAREALQLGDSPRGLLRVQPRAIERAGETAAAQHGTVARARARLDEERLVVELTVTSAHDLGDIAAAARQRVRAVISAHGLPAYAVTIIVAGFEPSTRKGLR